MSPPSANRDLMLRLRRYRRERAATRRLLSALASGEPVDWRRLDDPARVTRRLLELGLDSYVDLLFGDDAEGSRAYREIIRTTQRSSAPTLLLGHAAARATGGIRLGGEKAATATGVLISARLVLTSERVLPTREVAQEASLVLAETSQGARESEQVPMNPDDFFYCSSELGIAVSAVRWPAGERSMPPPLSRVTGSTLVVGERASQLCAQGSGDVQVRPCVVDLRHGRFLYYDAAEAEAPPEATTEEPGTSTARGAPLFDASWNLVALVRDSAGDIGEAVELREIEAELRRVGDHYGEVARRYVSEAFRADSPMPPTSPPRDDPDPTDIIIPIRIRLSISPEPAQTASSAGGREDRPAPAGALAPLPTPGIDLDATDGPDEVPNWTNEGALGPRGAEHFFRAREHFAGAPDETRLWYWGTRLLLESRRRSRLRAIPGYAYTAAGFLDPHAERNPDGYFGLIVYTTAADRPSQPEFLKRIEIEGERFPVVVRPIRFERQAPTTQPAAGWSSCWARTKVKSGQTLGPGILTAQHVYDGYSLGQQVPLENGTRGVLLDVAPPGIDAAVVQTDEAPPPDARTLTVTPYVAAGSPATMQLRDRIVETTVVETNNTFLVFDSAALPLRIGFQHAGVAGDSGGLVLDHTGTAIGIYLGMAVNIAEQRLGLAQHLFQASEVMQGMEVLL